MSYKKNDGLERMQERVADFSFYMVEEIGTVAWRKELDSETKESIQAIWKMLLEIRPELKNVFWDILKTVIQNESKAPRKLSIEEMEVATVVEIAQQMYNSLFLSEAAKCSGGTDKQAVLSAIEKIEKTLEKAGLID